MWCDLALGEGRYTRLLSCDTLLNDGLELPGVYEHASPSVT